MWLALVIACSTPSSTSVTVQAAPAADARRLAVTGGELRVELMTTWSPDCAEGAICRSVFVAPLVPLDWTPEAPVPVWVSCKAVLQKPIECMVALKQAKTYEGPVRSRIGVSGSSSWDHAVERAHQTYSLTSSPGAPVVELDFMPTISG